MSKLLTRIFFIILITPTLSYAVTRYGIGPDVIKDNIAFDKFQGSAFITEEERNIETTTEPETATTTKIEDAEKKKTEAEKKEGSKKKFGSKIRDKISDIKDKSAQKRIERKEKKAIEENNGDVVEDTENNNTEPEKELTNEQQLAKVAETDTESVKEAQEKKVAELQENYDNMKEIENSFENRMLGATGIASMGMGGMQLATAMTEDRADDAAEQQMKAYLATFSCTYANGKRFSGGETAIELPGGNELINLYSEYVGLANDLKTRKEALNLRPGIEAQPILDSATSGLYDDIATGKTTGAFTSLARALSDPNGEDAAAWAAQREETAKQKKTALTTIGVGAVATVAGNLLINRNNEKERSAEILEKYEDLKKELDKTEQQISKQPTNTTQKKCTDFSLSGTYPECKCTKDTQKFNQDEGQCNEQQTPEPETETEKQSLELTTFDMADLFETGKSVLTENAKNTLQQTNIKDFINETNTYCIEINGYSDNVGWKECSDKKDINTCNNNNNKELSEQRAKAVATALGINASNENCKKIKIQGKGCTTEKCTRTVEIATCDKELNNTCTATN